MEHTDTTRTRTSQVINGILVLLVISALVLGYLVYQRWSMSVSNSNSAVTTTETTQNQNSIPTAQRSNQIGGHTFAESTDAERQALNPPNSDTATEEEMQAHFAAIEEAAVATDTIHVGEACAISPRVSRVKLDEALVIINHDTDDHRIVFNEQLQIAVPAERKITVQPEFDQGAGIYGFGCDRSQSAVGMMLVTE